jgi:acetyl-CoA acetyltransferase
MLLMIVGLSALLGVDYYSKLQIERALAEISKAGGIYARDEEAPHRPVVSIDLDSILVDDTGHVHRKCNASDKLLTLIVRFDRLRELSLHGASVTDAGMAHLIGLESLRLLNLRGTRITDASLPHLARLQGLDWLDIRETQFSAGAIAALRRALPRTNISTDAD